MTARVDRREYPERPIVGVGAAIVRDGRVVGVLDLDSPKPARFDSDDAAGLEALIAVIGARVG